MKIIVLKKKKFYLPHIYKKTDTVIAAIPAQLLSFLNAAQCDMH